jgi:signal transduction histidine kinase/ActR/RegA family two-component response regulator
MYTLLEVDENTHTPTFGTLLKRVHNEDKAQFEQKIQTAFHDQSPFEFQHRLEMPDGYIKYCHSIGIIHNYAILSATMQDITETKVEENKIEASKKSAQEANKAKSTFLANMSHEIRTPLNGIIGLTNLTLETELNSEQRNYLNSAKTSSLALLHVLNDILDYSKIEAGKLEMEQIPFNLYDTIQQVYDLFQFRAEEKNLDFYITIDKNVPDFIVSDPVRLTQIVNNLVGNALKFTNQGNIHIHISLIGQTQKQCELQFSIEDTGIGMTKEQSQKLFTAFAQADSSTTRQYGGTGLGLSICKQLIHIMHGTIWVESEVGKGSQFRFTIFVDIANEGQVQDLGLIMQYQTPKYLDGNTVLLAEDNEINQMVAKKSLEKYHLNVVVVNNGLEAYNLAQQSMYDMIIMDLQMPIMDGLTATKKIRKLDNHKNTPIIAMTAAVMKQDKIASQIAGMNRHISKPIEQKELKNILFEYLTPKHSVDTPPKPRL